MSSFAIAILLIVIIIVIVIDIIVIIIFIFAINGVVIQIFLNILADLGLEGNRN